MTKDKRKKIIPLFKKIKQTDLRIFFCKFCNFNVLTNNAGAAGLSLTALQEG